MQKVADNINDIEEFGDLPSPLLHRLSQILSKRRALNSRTLNLFLRPDLDSINIYDCASMQAIYNIALFFFFFFFFFPVLTGLQNLKLMIFKRYLLSCLDWSTSTSALLDK